MKKVLPAALVIGVIVALAAFFDPWGLGGGGDGDGDDSEVTPTGPDATPSLAAPMMVLVTGSGLTVDGRPLPPSSVVDAARGAQQEGREVHLRLETSATEAGVTAVRDALDAAGVDYLLLTPSPPN